jgi:hypothetical protein
MLSYSLWLASWSGGVVGQRSAQKMRYGKKLEVVFVLVVNFESSFEYSARCSS